MELKIPQRQVMTTSSTGQPLQQVNDQGARSLRQLGNNMSAIGAEIEQKTLQAERSAKAAEAVNEYRFSSESYLNERASKNGLYDTLEKDWLEKDVEIQSSILDNLDDQTVKSAVSAKMRQMGGGYRLSASQTARKQRIEYAQTATQNSIVSMTRAAVESSDPDSIFKDIDSMMDRQANNGIFTPVKARSMAIDAKQDVYIARIKRDMAEDPETTYYNLVKEEYYPGLLEDKRATLTETARKRMETKMKKDENERIRREKEEERQLKIRQDRNEGLAYSLLMENRLDEEWLEDARERRYLDSTAYKQLKDALYKSTASGGVTDPEKLHIVTALAYGGGLTVSDLFGQIGEGVSYDDIKELLPVVQEGGPMFKTREYTEAMDYVRESVGAVKGMGAMSPDLGPKVANMSRELYERVKMGENPMEAADNIVGRYNKRNQGVPVKRLYPDTDKTELLNLLKTGKITPIQYNLEVEMLETEQRRQVGMPNGQ